MGNAIPSLASSLNHKHLKCDRMINLQNPNIMIGASGFHDKDNPIGHQCIKINGEPEVHELKSFDKTDTTLTYHFDSNIQLRIMKDKEKVLFHLKDPTKDIDTTQEMVPQLRSFFKNVSFGSAQFDNIEPFVKQSTIEQSTIKPPTKT